MLTTFQDSDPGCYHAGRVNFLELSPSNHSFGGLPCIASCTMGTKLKYGVKIIITNVIMHASFELINKRNLQLDEFHESFESFKYASFK